MKALILIVGAILLVISCNPTDRSTNIIERDFTINVATEIGQDFGEGALRVSKLNELLTLDSFNAYLNIEVAFNLPKGWHVSTPWKHIGSTGHRFTVKDQRELTNSAILIGEYAEAVAKSGKTQVSLAIGGSLKASKAEMQRTIEKFFTGILRSV